MGKEEIHVKINEEIARSIEELAQRMGVTKTELVETALAIATKLRQYSDELTAFRDLVVTAIEKSVNLPNVSFNRDVEVKVYGVKYRVVFEVKEDNYVEVAIDTVTEVNDRKYYYNIFYVTRDRVYSEIELPLAMEIIKQALLKL